MSDRFELQDEIQALQDIENYNIQNGHDPNSEDITALLEGKYYVAFVL
jgi:condensin complex subunit 1